MMHIISYTIALSIFVVISSALSLPYPNGASKPDATESSVTSDAKSGGPADLFPRVISPNGVITPKAQMGDDWTFQCWAPHIKAAPWITENELRAFCDGLGKNGVTIKVGMKHARTAITHGFDNYIAFANLYEEKGWKITREKCYDMAFAVTGFCSQKPKWGRNFYGTGRFFVPQGVVDVGTTTVQ